VIGHIRLTSWACSGGPSIFKVVGKSCPNTCTTRFPALNVMRYILRPFRNPAEDPFFQTGLRVHVRNGLLPRRTKQVPRSVTRHYSKAEPHEMGWQRGAKGVEDWRPGGWSRTDRG